MSTEVTPRCGAKTVLEPVYWRIPLSCDREPGHPPPHRQVHCEAKRAGGPCYEPDPEWTDEEGQPDER